MRAHPLLLALLVPFSASAQDVSWDVANTLGRAAMGAVSARDVRGRCVSCGEPDGPAERFAATLPGGFWGGGRGEPFMRLAQAGVTPVNLGFQALGPKGASGRISGPGLLGFGDGTYTVLENSPFMVVLRMQTGYVNGRFVLKRDASSGLDVIGFAGHVMENGGWGPYKEGFNPGRVTYDAAADRGTVQWLVNGERREDRYERGGQGSRAMRITLNGHNHDFFRE